MLYMIYIARGEGTPQPPITPSAPDSWRFPRRNDGLPGMWSGELQKHLGYQHFFIWGRPLATIPGFIVTALIPLGCASLVEKAERDLQSA